jgi:thioesterase domain-containing protein
MEEGEVPSRSVSAMAARYLAELRQLQPHGPYRLGGWSFGGLVAFEMAQQLEEQGETVQGCVLIDSYFHRTGFAVSGMSEPELCARFLKDLAFQAGKPGRFSSDTVAGLLREATEAKLLGEGLGLGDLQRILAVFRANCEAYVTYQPRRKLHGPVTLLVASDLSYIGSRQEVEAWRAWVGGEVAVHVVEGNHFTMMAGASLERIARLMNAGDPLAAA